MNPDDALPADSSSILDGDEFSQKKWKSEKRWAAERRWKRKQYQDWRDTQTLLGNPNNTWTDWENSK
ncbi:MULTISPECIES: hypothetical protein [Rhodococcus]|uniref:Uncharacterized protein n=1 Tax=Rhodococcus qingshengii JCM 15477 TaxID=1303681 RepID=A0AB38R9Q7_RHOSG|nr:MULTISPECIES: hypothetical protein [Rhodococcus]QXC42196.1 hypothetical protein KSE96_24460 [Rhodococcus qingshengii]UPU42191.1 hypothetical protein M0639_24680 [Rhodococcus qingshengii JCM 15477]